VQLTLDAANCLPLTRTEAKTIQKEPYNSTYIQGIYWGRGIGNFMHLKEVSPFSLSSFIKLIYKEGIGLGVYNALIILRE